MDILVQTIRKEGFFALYKGSHPCLGGCRGPILTGFNTRSLPISSFTFVIYLLGNVATM